MVLGRLVHYTLDVVLVSTVLAGVKRHTGFQVNTTAMPEGPVRNTADSLLFAGDRVFDIVAATSFSSSWFEKEPRKPTPPQ
ncbi:hypothetical protein JCM8115_007104 [Rhodotorula mucilaginosa]|uniref:DUF1748-domain-containing protein n=1 Tax=Rhodotorula mucilaginosa TaxID=5537 RepID=A0A9P7B260_RHOMI|nr:hypothetical protein C6P46_001542 [Rhodotorula mucilaginosa]KWU43518.1 DUF1748-domain-containing protein [Rhodotorula sp. JG-1b]TKA50194.1 hypothetical protein B0A53_06454 [Rhodotorula sp. CCFEE 5036]